MKNSIGLLGLLMLFLMACEDEKETFIPLTKPEVQFSEFTDSRDGNVYKCITVGGQTWMAENLRYRIYGGSEVGCFTYNEGKVPYVTPAEVSAEMDNKALSGAIYKYYIANARNIGMGTIGIWDYFFPNLTNPRDLMTYPQIINILINENVWPRPPYSNYIDSLYLEAYMVASPIALRKKANGLADYEYAAEHGYLYTYPAIHQVIPEGWALPTDNDWQILERNLGMQEGELALKNEWRGLGIGTLLKEGEEGIGFNARMSGINAYGAGLNVSTYMKKGLSTFYWTNTLESVNDSTAYAIVRELNLVESGVLRGTSPLIGKGTNILPAYSLRCIKK